MENKFNYCGDNFLIGDKEFILESLKQNMFNDDLRNYTETLIDKYNEYQEVKDSFNASIEELFMIKFNDMDGSVEIQTNDQLGIELIDLAIKGYIIEKK